MKQGLILPILAAALFIGACEEDGDPTGNNNTQANVRFVNAVTGLNSNLAFTANGTMAGTALGFGQATTQCTRVNAGSSNFAFGTANAGGTGISGTALSTFNPNLQAGGNFTVIAYGTAANPRSLVLNNNQFSGSVGNNQAAVRFVNLVPGTGGAATNFNVFTGTTTTGTPTASGVGFGNTSNFSTVSSGNNTFTFTNPTTGATVFSGSGTQLNLTGGSVNTIALLPNAAGTGFQLVNITPCP